MVRLPGSFESAGQKTCRFRSGWSAGARSRVPVQAWLAQPWDRSGRASRFDLWRRAEPFGSTSLTLYLGLAAVCLSSSIARGRARDRPASRPRSPAPSPPSTASPASDRGFSLQLSCQTMRLKQQRYRPVFAGRGGGGSIAVSELASAKQSPARYQPSFATVS
jgi:hypothetical protein